MTRSRRAMRLRILSYLFKHLKAIYHIDWPRKVFGTGEISEHDVEALVAFKSDPQLDELHAALIRLESKNFGICIRCAQEIGQDLLDADPTRRLCGECEKDLNRPPSAEMNTAHGLTMAHQDRHFKNLRESG